MSNLREIQNRFILNEGYSPPDIHTYIQSLEEVLSSISASSAKDVRRIAIAKENLKNIRKQSRRMQAEHQELQERVLQLEESSSNKRK